MIEPKEGAVGISDLEPVGQKHNVIQQKKYILVSAPGILD